MLFKPYRFVRLRELLMKINADYHTHTRYSHGKGSVMDNAGAAKKAGLCEIAITDHGFSHPAFGMRRRKLNDMRRDCTEAEKVTGVKVLLGIESNILGDSGKIDVKTSDYDKLDLIVAGVHRCVFYDKPKDYAKLFIANFFYDVLKKDASKSLRDYNTRVYINAIKNNPIDIISHLDYRVDCDVKAVADCAADYGTYIEINTKKVHMTREEWYSVFSSKANFLIDSDAHSPERVGDVSLFNQLEKEGIAFPKDRIFNIGDKHPVFRFERFKQGL